MKELKRLCYQFGIGDLQEVIGFLGGGYINMNIQIRTSKGNYVVRLFLLEMEEERLEYAYSIVSMLSKEGVPTLVPILNLEGLPYSRYKGYLVQITPFIEALPFRWISSQAYHSGKMLRIMHQTLTAVEESPTSTGGYQYFHLDPLSIINRLKENGHTLPSHEGTGIEDFFTLLNQHEIDTSNLPMTIIHGDWNPWNQLYKRNGEVCCVMDFDTLQRGERVFDVAYALYFYLIQHGDVTLGQGFLKGYGSLTEEEIAVLPILIARVGLYFGILVEEGEFQFARNKARLEWVISAQGRRTLQRFCSRDS